MDDGVQHMPWCIPMDWQCYSLIDLKCLSRLEASSWQQRLTQMQGGDNQNACCGGRVIEHSSSESDNLKLPAIPPQLQSPIGGIDARTKVRRVSEDKEARKLRLTSGTNCRSLCNDALVEPLPPRLRRPGEGKLRVWKKPAERAEQSVLKKPLQNMTGDVKEQQALDESLYHLPFFKSSRYNRLRMVKMIARRIALHKLISYGRYYIEKDWKNYFDPRMDPETLFNLVMEDKRRHAKFRCTGAVNRIVDLFMEKVLDWTPSKEMVERSGSAKKSCIALLWLGPHLARKAANELCIVNDPTRAYQLVEARSVDEDFYVINRLGVDIFFSDKEAFYCMLKDYIFSPALTCKNRSGNLPLSGDSPESSCLELAASRAVTRQVCVHQNLSLSLKPCMVRNCRNYNLPVCRHLYAFIPETITISSYASMLHFLDRLGNAEDLGGCIFITKPAYLCNGRGINFLVKRDQFEFFYHILEGKPTSRHGVVLQRYIECPRLFDRCKFTIRFFLLIIVLRNRHVLGFIHYGIAIFCLWPYEPVRRDESPDPTGAPVKNRLGRVLTEQFSRHCHIAGHRGPEFTRRCQTHSVLELDEDNVYYVDDVLPKQCLNSKSIYIQMLFAAQCIMDYIQPIVHHYPGTFQTISVDSLVDARNKLWILEAGTKIFSSLLTSAPRQRQIMSDIIQESLGVTVECFYKSLNSLPLYWDYKKDCEDYDAFCFAQDFNFFYETDLAKLPDCKRPSNEPAKLQKKPLQQDKRLEDRYREVDNLRVLTERRKAENAQKKKEIINKTIDYISKLRKKQPEES